MSDAATHKDGKLGWELSHTKRSVGIHDDRRRLSWIRRGSLMPRHVCVMHSARGLNVLLALFVASGCLVGADVERSVHILPGTRNAGFAFTPAPRLARAFVAHHGAVHKQLLARGADVRASASVNGTESFRNNRAEEEHEEKVQHRVRLRGLWAGESVSMRQSRTSDSASWFDAADGSASGRDDLDLSVTSDSEETANNARGSEEETANEECPVHFHGQGCLKRCKPEIHCSGNGRCSYEGSCVCYDGFHGDDCANKCIGGSFLEEHGCAAIEHGCAVGFFGDDCTNHMIDFDVANGRPVGVEGSIECYFNFEGKICDQCTTGYYGRNCENFCKSDTTCNARGFCSQYGLCSCMQGFRGENCEQCAQGFYGADCSIFCDTKTTCGGTGMCDGEGSCVCDEGFTGEKCEKD